MTSIKRVHSGELQMIYLVRFIFYGVFVCICVVCVCVCVTVRGCEQGHMHAEDSW